MYLLEILTLMVIFLFLRRETDYFGKISKGIQRVGHKIDNIQDTIKGFSKSVIAVEPIHSSVVDVELLTSAGQRHCGNPKEPQPLAEDVAGLISIPPYYIGYVTDGAPGPQLSGLFTSRIHARILGHEVFLNLAQEALRVGEIPGLKDKEHFLQELQERMRKELLKVLGMGIINMLKAKRDILPRFKGQPGLEWQASFTGFIFDVHSRKLYLYQMGDTVACIGKLDSEAVEIRSGKPLYTQLILKEEKIELEFTVNPIVEEFLKVQGIVVMSDGVYGAMSTLRNLSQADFKSLVENLRKISIPSGDDKTLLIISARDSIPISI